MVDDDQLSRWINHAVQFFGGIGAGVGAMVLRNEDGITAVIVIAGFLFLTFAIKEFLQWYEPQLRRTLGDSPKSTNNSPGRPKYGHGQSARYRYN